MTLYAMSVSGNCWKVAWMLRLCGVPHKIVATTYDGANGTLRTRSPEFLSKNPNGQTPLLELDDGRFLAESNAILLYLTERYQKMMPPPDPANCYLRGQVYQWLFFEQYSHEPYIAVRRANIIFQRPTTAEAMQKLLEKGNNALQVMEVQPKKTSSFIAGGSEPSVADIALYAYTGMAEEGGYDFTQYPAVKSWLARIKALPYFEGTEILREIEYVPPK